MSETARPRRRLLRRLILVLLAILVVLAVALPIIWMQIASNAKTMTQTFLAKEAARGRQWTCPGKSVVSGFPFSMIYDCDEARFDGILGGHQVKASVKGFHAAVFLLWPAHPAASMDGPMQIESEGGDHVALAWQSFVMGGSLVPFGIDHVDGAVDKLTATLVQDAEQTRMLEAEKLSVNVRKLSSSPANDLMVEITARLVHAVSPFVDHAVSSEGGLDAHAVATLDQVGTLERGSLSDRLEAWRLAGGRLTLREVHSAKGTSVVDAKGVLGLDDGHRLDGTIDASVAGIEPFLKRLGIPTSVAAFGGLLSGLMGGTAQAAEPNALSLKIRLSDGKVYAGPIRLHTQLRPLY